MKKIVFFFIFLIFCFEIMLCEIRNRELIKIRITIGATNYFRYVQLSSPDYSNSFKIIKERSNMKSIKKSKFEKLEDNIFDMATLFKELEKNQNVESNRYFQKRSESGRKFSSCKDSQYNVIKSYKKEKASDIHIESYKECIRIRYKIDGVLERQER